MCVIRNLNKKYTIKIIMNKIENDDKISLDQLF